MFLIRWFRRFVEWCSDQDLTPAEARKRISQMKVIPPRAAGIKSQKVS